jgi:four helix bundle protein
VVARHFIDLIAWQLADELRRQVIAFTSKTPCSRDFKFCSRIRDAADSSCFNTAEGFGRFRPKEFERFLGFAKGSLEEIQDALVSAKRKNYLQDSEFQLLWRLSMRAVIANAKLQAYLRTRGRFGPITISESDSDEPEPRT